MGAGGGVEAVARVGQWRHRATEGQWGKGAEGLERKSTLYKHYASHFSVGPTLHCHAAVCARDRASWGIGLHALQRQSLTTG